MTVNPPGSQTEKGIRDHRPRTTFFLYNFLSDITRHIDIPDWIFGNKEPANYGFIRVYLSVPAG